MGYVRVSTEDQGRSGLGLDAQRQVIRSRYAEAEVVTEVQSAGSLRSRPVLRGVLDALVRGDVLAVSKVDRLAPTSRAHREREA